MSSAPRSSVAVIVTTQPLPTDVPGYPINGMFTLALLVFCVLTVHYVRKLRK